MRKFIKMRFLTSLLILFLFYAAFAYSQEGGAKALDAETIAEDEVFVLPEAAVSVDRDTPETITREEMDRNGANDLWEAVRDTPGVILSGGGRRGDSGFSVRGFGSDSVPMFVDGVLLANPYRGESDSARILTGDLEGIEIKKGYGSELLGANSLGGAVLMQTAKPVKSFEAFLRSSLGVDDIFRYADSNQVLSLGTRLEYFYARAVFQYRNINHWRLPENFDEREDNPQKKGSRLWSDSDDLKFTLMAGTTPVPDLDIWITYIFQNADKGFSPPEVKTEDYEIWNWPFWQRHSISLNSIYDKGIFSISSLFYFDKYDNRLDEYYHWKAYLRDIHAPHSDYDEYSAGARLGGKWEINSRNTLETAITYKREDHRGLRGNIYNEDMKEETHINEDTWSVGLEYTVNPWASLTVKAGVGFDMLVPNKFWNEENEYLKLLDSSYFIVKTRTMFLYTWQAGVFYKLPFGTYNNDHELRLTYARKNHFPNMSQRYSTRFSSNLPNPNLGPEIANHFELAYGGSFFDKILIVNAAVYYSIVTGKIVNIELPNPHYPGSLVDYPRNLDSIALYGFELAPELYLSNFFSLGLFLSINQYTILTSYGKDSLTEDPVKALTGYPSFTANMYVVIKPFERFRLKGIKNISIIPRLEYASVRYADTAGKTKLDPYLLLGLKISADITSHFTLSLSAANLLDMYYELQENFPQPGRSFNVTLTARY